MDGFTTEIDSLDILAVKYDMIQITCNMHYDFNNYRVIPLSMGK